LAGATATAEELTDRLDDRGELLLGDARVDGQREQLVGERLGDREVTAQVPEPREGR
jgi:hypothetical protein